MTRPTNMESQIVGYLSVAGGVLFLVMLPFESMRSTDTYAEIGGGTVLLGILAAWLRIEERRRQARWDELVARFGEEIAELILKKTLWQGATSEMVVEMLGRPASVDEKVLKTKVKRAMKYQPLAKRQYGLRVLLEDDVVVGWERNRG